MSAAPRHPGRGQEAARFGDGVSRRVSVDLPTPHPDHVDRETLAPDWDAGEHFHVVLP